MFSNINSNNFSLFYHNCPDSATRIRVNPVYACPIRAKHEAELAASAIHPDLWENFKTVLDNKNILDYLLVGDLPRTNTGRVSSEWLHKYDGLESGWVVETVGSDFVQFKPDQPRTSRYWDKGYKESTIKYESPAKLATDIIRLRHLPHWITGGKSAQDWWETVVNVAEEGWITEGAKKAASLLSLGLPAVALPGIFNTKEKKDGDIIPQLLEYVKSKKIIHLCFDAPDKLTQHYNLEESYRQLKNIIKAANPTCEVRIVCWDWWKGKGIDDAIVAGHITEPVLFSLPYYEGLMFLNTNIPAYRRITGQRYITPELVDNFENKYTAMVVGKDGGKTQTAGTYLRSLPASVPVLNPTHRIKLGQQLAPRLGTRYLNDSRGVQAGLEKKLTLCINSMNIENVNPDDYKDAVVFLDEVVQLCDFIYSGTIKKAVEVIHNLRTILSGASKLILADADLDYKTLALLDDLMQGCNFLKTVKIYELKKEVDKIPMHIYKVSNRKVGAATYEAALAALIRGEKILVMVDSQQPKSKLSAEVLKRSLEEGYKQATGNDIRGLALYATASKNKALEASRVVTEGIDIVYEYDFVVYTTVIGTGVSLDKDKDLEKPHFDRVIGGFSGAIGINDVLQGLHRYRRNVPREVYIPNKGIAASHVGNTYSWKSNSRNTYQIKLNVLTCYHAIAHEIPGSDAINRPLETYHAKVRAYGKYECDNFFDIFCRRAEKDYDLVIDGISKKVVVPTILENIVEEVFNEHVETIVNAKVIDDERKYEEIKAKQVVLDKEAKDFNKTGVAKKYRLEYHEALINQDLVTLDSSVGYHSGIQNHYYLDKLYYAEERGKQNIKRETLDFEKFRKDPLVKARLMLELGANKLIENAGEILSHVHPLVQEIVENYKRIEAIEPGLIYRHLHIGLDEKNPMQSMIDKLAAKLAMSRESKGRIMLPNKKRVSKASYTIADTIRYDIFKVWDENNEMDITLTGMSEIRDSEAKVLETLKKEDTPEEQKQELRKKLAELSQTNDQYKEYLQNLNETRNQRKIDYEDSIRERVEATAKVEQITELNLVVQELMQNTGMTEDEARIDVAAMDAELEAFCR